FYKCPSDRAVLIVGKERIPRIRSYSMNCYLGWNNSPADLNDKYLIFKKAGDLARAGPANIFLFQDVVPENLCYPAFMIVMLNAGTEYFFHYPSSQHSGMGEVAFSDGHVEGHMWLDSRTRPRVTQIDFGGVSFGLVGHMYHSDGNQDFAWLFQRTTIPK